MTEDTGRDAGEGADREAAREMKIGYARVSTGDQDAGAQIAALKRAGCRTIFTDHASGAAGDRPQLAKALQKLKDGDDLVVWKLDRLSRSLQHLLNLIATIAGAGARFRSLTEAIDTATPAGKMLLQILGSFAEFERNIIRERTSLGLAAARNAGVRFGRPRKLNGNQVGHAQQLLGTGSNTIPKVAATLKVSPATLKRALKRARQAAMIAARERATDGSKAQQKHKAKSPACSHAPRRCRHGRARR